MCGIVGLFNQPELSISKMSGAISHRGPDAQGIYQNGYVSLGHRRLSIIDLTESANQPLVKDGLVIVFNGEVYNYKELAAELNKQGVNFNTNSDTEVVLEAWRAWGARSLNRLRGMFAFAIYDEQSQGLFLARDEFGIKPLFYKLDGNKLIFSSELKSLKALSLGLEVDPQAVVTHLEYLWLPDNQCIYKGVQKFPSGCYAQMSMKSGLRIKRYSDIFEPSNKSNMAPGDCVASLQKTIEDSVDAHMIADVPVSVLLSGGLDSSIIASLASRNNPDIEAYTIAFRSEDKKFEAMPDDAFYARKVAKMLDIKLNEIEITPNIVELWPKLVAMLDEPIGDAAAINTYLICEAARKAGSKVLLSGMGADEIFAGYRKHYACLLAAKYRRLMPKFGHKSLEFLVNKLPVASGSGGYRYIRWLKRFLAFAGMPEEAAFQRSYSYYSQCDLGNLLSKDYQQYLSKPFVDHSKIYNKYADLDQINRMCYVDSQWFMRGLNLTYSDRASMAASSEVRVPFVDKEVVTCAFSMPGKVKIRKGKTKSVLKEAARAWLPDEIINRPKAGFAAPLRSWIRGELKPMIDDYLLSSDGFLSRDICNRDAVNIMIRDDRAGKFDYSQQIWQFLTLEIWLRE